jgi:uncharacterized protein (DUF1697 family)
MLSDCPGESHRAYCAEKGPLGYAFGMTVYAALLRAVNVGGSGKLAMSELRELCEDAGLENARTYIQSGNVVFSTRLGVAKATQVLSRALAEKMGKPVGVHLRTANELGAILARNPFAAAPDNRVLVYFLDSALPEKALAAIAIPGREEMLARGREVFVHYPDGMGRSKLKLPFASTATARNLRTVGKLVELCRA